MPDYQARCTLLETENDMLRERVAQLEAQLAGAFRLPIEFGLTPRESIVLGVLLQRDFASKATICTALYGSRAEGEVAEPKIVDVFICKIRAKLKRFGFEIKTKWGEGYWLPAETKDALRHACKSVAEAA